METTTPLSKIQSIELSPEQYPITNVIVYNDRAEVQRTVSVTVRGGETELLVGNLSTQIDTTSVRVASVSGKATLLEVTTKEVTASSTVDVEKEIQGLRDSLEDLQQDLVVAQKVEERVRSEQDWLNGYSGTQKSIRPQDGVLNDNQVSGAKAFLDFYSEKLEALDSRHIKAQREIKKIQKDISELNTKISTLSLQSSTVKATKVQSVLLLIHADADTDVSLQLKYLVMGASWTASYDVRVTDGKPSVDLTYYGNIINNTKESWSETAISLSTAKPSNPGAPGTTLSTLEIGLNQKGYHYNNFNSTSTGHNPLFNPGWGGSGESLEDLPSRMHKSSSVSKSATVVSFVIPRKATIASDGQEHKLTINILEFPATFEYSIAPKISVAAYLKANLVNNSPYPVLPGPMNVFMEGDFVTKSKISNPVSPNEGVGLFLGTDDNIKVVYNSERIAKKESGVFQKTSSMEWITRALVTNNTNKEVTIVLFDQVPKSNNPQLVVKLVEPEGLKLPEDISKLDMNSPVMLTPSNNLRWKFKLRPSKRQEVKSVSLLEYPSDKSLYIASDYNTTPTSISSYSPSSPAYSPTSPVYDSVNSRLDECDMMLDECVAPTFKSFYSQSCGDYERF